jgi:NAD(P)H-flavin reductase
LGVPTKLLKKTLVVSEDVTTGRLPVYTLTFEIPPPDPVRTVPPAVHHSALRLDRGDVVKMVIPNYKPKSYSVSELRDGEFDVTFKVYPNGRASGYLDRLPVGSSDLHSFGKHVARTHNPGSYVGIVVFGVGITEGYPVAMAELERGTGMVVLVWACRYLEDTFWHDKLRALLDRHGDRFQVVYVVSRQTEPSSEVQHEQPPSATSSSSFVSYHYGKRLSPTLLEEIFQPPTRDEARFLTVGTKEMMKQADAMIDSIGYPMPQHHLLPKIK